MVYVLIHIMVYWALGFLGISFFTAIDFNWRNQVAIGFIWAGLVAIWSGLKQYDFTFKAALSFLLFHLGYYVLQSKTPYPMDDPTFPIKMDAIILHSAVGIAVCVGAAHAFLKRDSAVFMTAICIMTLFGSVLLIVKPAFGLLKTAFLNSDSMDGTLIAIGFPFVRRVTQDMRDGIRKTILLSLPVLAVFFSGSSMGLLCLAVALVTHIPAKGTRREIREALTMAGLVAIGLVSVGIFFLQQEAFNFNGRLDIWKASMAFWDKYVNVFTGSGLSTFNHFGALVQHMYGVDHLRTRWIWMHSDWLQILFETGITGLVFSVMMSVRALFLTFRKSPMLFSSLCTIFVACLANMPFRYFPSGFICLVILMQALMIKDENGNPLA